MRVFGDDPSATDPFGGVSFDPGATDGFSNDGNGDLPDWGVQQLPTITVQAPNPFAVKPQVIDTTRPMLTMTGVPDVGTGAKPFPWLMVGLAALGGYFLLKKSRGFRNW